MKALSLFLIIIIIPALFGSAETYAAGSARPLSVQSVYSKTSTQASVDVLEKYTGVEAANDRYISNVVTLGAASLGALAKQALKYAGPAALLINAALDVTGAQVTYDSSHNPTVSPYYWQYANGTAAGYFFYNQTLGPCIGTGNTCMAESVGVLAEFLRVYGEWGECVTLRQVDSIINNGTAINGIYGSYTVRFAITYNSLSGGQCQGDYRTDTFTQTLFRRAISSPLSGTFVDSLVDIPALTDAELGNYLLTNSDAQLSTGQIAELLAEAIRAGYYTSWPELAASLLELANKLDPTSSSYDPDYAGSASDEVTPASSSGTGDITVDIELPTDYNREATQQQILESLTPDTTATQAQVDADKDSFLSSLPSDVSSLGITEYSGAENTDAASLGNGVANALASAGTCTNPTYTLAGHTMDIEVCEFWEPLRPIMAFLVWTMVAVYAFRRVSDVRAG